MTRRYWFQVWWVDTDGKAHAETQGEATLGECQRTWADWARGMERWPDTVVKSGLSPIGSPPEGPWPRDGDAGREDRLVRSPERDREQAA